jgi:hypothetical protein
MLGEGPDGHVPPVSPTRRVSELERPSFEIDARLPPAAKEQSGNGVQTRNKIACWRWQSGGNWHFPQ